MTDLPDPAEVAEALDAFGWVLGEFDIPIHAAARAYTDSEEVWWCIDHRQEAGEGVGSCAPLAPPHKCRIVPARLILEDTND